MAANLPALRTVVLLCAVVCGIGLHVQARENTAKTAVPQGLEGVWDPAKYISVDEVRPGMEAYCLTVYKGVEVEKFPVEVLSVVHDFTPGRDSILVRGTDERFIHTGPVAGCSGSPVYIDGRLAGALATGWLFSKDPLYGVTPIAEMLRVGKTASPRPGPGGAEMSGPGLVFDFSSPIDFSQVEKRIPMALSSGRTRPSLGGGATILPSPLVVSGVPESVIGDLENQLGPLGFMVVSAGGGVSTDVCNVNLAPGACLTVPLVAGDITLNVTGTVTEVRGDEVYGFGHSFLGYGAVDLPMATGQIAMLSGPVGVSTAEDRVDGYCRAMAESGLPVDAGNIFHGEFTQQSGYHMAQQALAISPRPTAFAAANNFIAIGALQAVRQAGLQVPEDLALVGFDDLPAALLVDPFFTMVAQPAYEMGKQATELLLARIAGQVEPASQEIILPVEVVIRRSSGAYVKNLAAA